jgi:hypothetical protein
VAPAAPEAAAAGARAGFVFLQRINFKETIDLIFTPFLHKAATSENLKKLIA